MALSVFEKDIRKRAIDAVGFDPYVMRVCQRHRKWKWSSGFCNDKAKQALIVRKLNEEFKDESRIEIEETYALGRSTMTFWAVEVRVLRK